MKVKIRKRFWVIAGVTLLLVVALMLFGVRVDWKRGTGDGMTTIGNIEWDVSFTIGTAEAAGLADYTCDGVNDNVEFQSALDALPAGGGKLSILAGTYSFSATVARAIDNVTIEGIGRSTYFTYDNFTPIFSAGIQSNWVFRDFRADNGGVNVVAASGWVMENVWLGATYYALRTDNSITASSLNIPVGRTSTIVVAASDSSDASKAQADYVCDGIADDVEIQAAIGDLPVGGGRVSLSEGQFNLSLAVEVTKDNVTLYGQGNATILKVNDVVQTTVSAQALVGQPDVTVTSAVGFTVGQQVFTGVGDGVSNVWEINRIASITGNVLTMETNLANTYNVGDMVYTAFHAIEAYENDYLTFNDFKIDGNKANNLIWSQYDTAVVTGWTFRVQNGIHLESCEDCRVSKVTVDSITGWGAISFDDLMAGGGGNSIRGQVSGCNIQNGVRHGIMFIAAVECSAIGNNLENNGTSDAGVVQGHGIILEAGNNSSIIGNSFARNNPDGIYAYNSSSVAITGNTFIANYHDIILCGNAPNYTQDYTITGNTFIDGATSGNTMISFDAQCRRITISGNTFYVDTVDTFPIVMAGSYFTVSTNSIYVHRPTWAIYISGGDYVMINDNVIVCDWGSPAPRGIYSYGTEVSIYDNYIDMVNSTSPAIEIDSPSSGIRIRGNRLTNYTTAVLNTAGADILMYEGHSDLFMDVLAVSPTAIRSNEDLSEAIPNTFTLDAQPDVPRTLSGHFDAHANITAYTIVITGVDAKGDTITETKTEANGWDWETSNAFATITSIIMTARTGTGAGDTMDIGITDVLGLSNVIYTTGDVFKIKKNNANAVVAVAQVNATYDTYDMAVIGLGGGDDFTIWFKSNLNIID